jgi:hypothetical protein
VVDDARFYGLEAKVDQLRRALGAPAHGGRLDLLHWRPTFITADAVATDAMLYLVDAAAGAITVTLPVATDAAGQSVQVQKTDASAYAVTVTDGTVTVTLAQPGDTVWLVCDGTVWRIVAPVPVVWQLAATDFGAIYGAPSLGKIVSTFYGPSTWRLDDSLFESIGLARVYDGLVTTTTIEVDVWYAMESATTGQVIFIGLLHPLSEGNHVDVDVIGAGMSITSTVPSTAKVLQKTTMTTTIPVSVSPGQVCAFSFARWSDLTGDTAAGDCHIVAVTVRFK